jgi:F420-non-reducing hydrogenase iron-sulfur subunit
MFRPRIIGFVCNWSLPPNLDFASVSGVRGHSKISIIRLVCTGRIDPALVLETFADGADGVLILGCHPPDCHYVDGNLHTERKIKMLKKLLSLTGLEPERLRLEWAYASEIERFTAIINGFRDQLMALGQSPLAGRERAESVALNVKAAKDAAEDFRLRVLVGRERELTEKENVYGEEISQQEFDALLHEVAEADFIRHKIRLLTTETPMSVKQIAAAVGKNPALILRHIVNMRKSGMIALDHVERTTPLYKALEVQ